MKFSLQCQAEKAIQVVTTIFWFPFKVKVNDNVNRPEGDEEEVVFDENEDAEDDEADIDAVSLVQEFEFCCWFFPPRIYLELNLLSHLSDLPNFNFTLWSWPSSANEDLVCRQGLLLNKTYLKSQIILGSLVCFTWKASQKLHKTRNEHFKNLPRYALQIIVTSSCMLFQVLDQTKARVDQYWSQTSVEKAFFSSSFTHHWF